MLPGIASTCYSNFGDRTFAPSKLWLQTLCPLLSLEFRVTGLWLRIIVTARGYFVEGYGESLERNKVFVKIRARVTVRARVSVYGLNY